MERREFNWHQKIVTSRLDIIVILLVVMIGIVCYSLVFVVANERLERGGFMSVGNFFPLKYSRGKLLSASTGFPITNVYTLGCPNCASQGIDLSWLWDFHLQRG